MIRVRKYLPLLLFLKFLFVDAENKNQFEQHPQQSVEVRLLELSVTSLSTAGNVSVKWMTEAEEKLREFNVYRSIDKENWYLVWTLSAKNKKGTNTYEFIDKTGSGGTNFYKLEVVYEQGQKQILGSSQIELEDYAKAIWIFPKPGAGQIRLESAEQIFSIELELQDILGRKYSVGFVRDNTHEITILTGPLAPGVYYLRCYLNQQRYVRKKALIL